MISLFQKKVYEAVRLIPKGRVSTYSAVAGAVGCNCPRAVGQALRVNPFAPEVPCHRVISSSLRIGGFQGQAAGSAVRQKQSLLEAEGVDFDGDGKLNDKALVFNWPN